MCRILNRETRIALLSIVSNTPPVTKYFVIHSFTHPLYAHFNLPVSQSVFFPLLCRYYYHYRCCCLYKCTCTCNSTHTMVDYLLRKLHKSKLFGVCYPGWCVCGWCHEKWSFNAMKHTKGHRKTVKYYKKNVGCIEK